MTDWIVWGGGDCPVARGTRVDVKYRGGEERLDVRALETYVKGPTAMEWSHLQCAYDIVAWRLHQPAPLSTYECKAPCGSIDCAKGCIQGQPWTGSAADLDPQTRKELERRGDLPLNGAATTAEAAPKEYTGGSVNYYKVKITNSTSGSDVYTAECNDIIEALGMNYAEGNAFKAIWRRCAARTLGLTKEGYKDGLYDAEKVVFFGQRMVAQERVK